MMFKVCLLIVLTGCMVGPRYHSPKLVAENNFVTECASDQVPPEKWWETFNDPLLTTLIQEAACYNYDVRIAREKIREARANKWVVSAPLLPQIDLNTYYDKNTFNQAFGGAAAAGLDEKSELFFWGFDALWEVDLFGRRRWERDAAGQQVFGAIESKNDILISIFAEVAINYFEARGYQARIENFLGWINQLESRKGLVEKRLRTGLDSELNLAAVESALSQIRAQLPPLKASLDGAIFRLSVLTGGLPDRLIEAMDEKTPFPKLPEMVSCGLPCELLRRRPDVRAKERELHQKFDLLRANELRRYPTVLLTGNIGRQTFKFAGFDQINAPVWGLTYNATAPVLHGGEIQGNILVARSQKDQAYLDYYKTAYEALEEAERNLSRYVQDKSRAEEAGKTVEAQSKLVELTDKRYAAGTESLLEVVDRQIDLSSFTDLELAAITSSFSSLVSLYKALGGGWECL